MWANARGLGEKDLVGGVNDAVRRFDISRNEISEQFVFNVDTSAVQCGDALRINEGLRVPPAGVT